MKSDNLFMFIKKYKIKILKTRMTIFLTRKIKKLDNRSNNPDIALDIKYLMAY